jgi:large subunit ribosomal protein L37Ae
MVESKNKKTRHTARFGARYGVSVKKRYETFEAKQRVKHVCPKCGFAKVQRVSTGIFTCAKCRLTYAGGAFYPQTLTGGIIAKMVAQRAFNTQLLEQIEDTPAHVREDVLPVELSDEERIEQLTQEKPAHEKKRKSRKMDTSSDSSVSESA